MCTAVFQNLALCILIGLSLCTIHIECMYTILMVSLLMMLPSASCRLTVKAKQLSCYKARRAIAGHPEQAEPLLSGGWMGSLTNLLLRTLLDVSVSISNAVVKLHARQTAATLMSKHIHIITAAGDWLSEVEVDQGHSRLLAHMSAGGRLQYKLIL